MSDASKRAGDLVHVYEEGLYYTHTKKERAENLIKLVSVKLEATNNETQLLIKEKIMTIFFII